MCTRNIKYYLMVMVGLLLVTSSCKEEKPFYLNNEDDLVRIQKKIEELAESNQIDSISIRSTDRKSLLSSIYLVLNELNNETEFSTAVEFLPQHKLTLKENTKTKKGALHNFKPNIPALTKYIESAKTKLPAEYTYKDIQSLRYSASPFGPIYYLGIEVNTPSLSEENEFVEVFYDNLQAKQRADNADLTPMDNVGDTHYVISFRVENESLEMIKIK